jgi:hypothetical protein
VPDLKLVSDVSAISGSARREAVERALEELNPEALFMDGLDHAIVGIGCQYSKDPVVVYEEERIIFALIHDGMDYEEAWEHYGFNIQCAWVGENTPIIIAGMDDLLER